MFGHTITRGGGWSSVPQGSIGRILEVFIFPLPLSLCTPWRINSRRANREDGRVCTFVLPKRNYTFEEKRENSSFDSRSSLSSTFNISKSRNVNSISTRIETPLTTWTNTTDQLGDYFITVKIQRDTHGSIAATAIAYVYTRGFVPQMSWIGSIRKLPWVKKSGHGIERGRNNTRGFRGGR